MLPREVKVYLTRSCPAQVFRPHNWPALSSSLRANTRPCGKCEGLAAQTAKSQVASRIFIRIQSSRMAYADDAVRAKLSALNETQDSIVSVAQWVMFHRYFV